MICLVAKNQCLGAASTHDYVLAINWSIGANLVHSCPML